MHKSIFSFGLAGALFVGLTGSAHAQFSDSYKFLQAVKEADANKVTEMVNKPGTTIINTRDLSSGQSALHIVMARRDLTWLNFLLAKGANPNIVDGSGLTPLMQAAQLRFVDGARLLLANKAQADKANGSGETPLIRAVQLHDLEMTRLLISAGANPDKRDLTGMSARDYAQMGRSNVLLDAINAAKPSVKSGPVQGPGL